MFLLKKDAVTIDPGEPVALKNSKTEKLPLLI
jgi:hypothetical protein